MSPRGIYERRHHKVVTRRLRDYPPPTPQPTPCRLWQGRTDANGYGLMPSVRHVDRRVHRWVWEQVNGPIPPGMQVHHHCDQPLCYRLDHLWVGTQRENIADRHAKGRSRGRTKGAH